MNTRTAYRRRLTGFSLVELLVAMAIIAVLAALLLVALKRVNESSKRAAALATMSAFLRACEAFQLEHGYPPGLIPERILAFNNHEIAHGGEHDGISSTENALLHLMGGYVLRDSVSAEEWELLRPDQGWTTYEIQGPNDIFVFKFNLAKFGEGPVIDGKAYPPYFTPRGSEVTIADAGGLQQWPWAKTDGASPRHLPDLVDPWGTPILYLRRAREFGPLVGDVHAYESAVAQFYVNALWPYTLAKSQEWQDPCGGGDGRGSILFGNKIVGGQEPWQIPKGLAKIIRHSLSGQVDPDDPNVPGTAIGAIIVISAGPDRVYFSAADGPGSPKRPIGSTGCTGYEAYSYAQFLQEAAEAMRLFDDLILSGGN